jgi:hypothetical protein
VDKLPQSLMQTNNAAPTAWYFFLLIGGSHS